MFRFSATSSGTHSLADRNGVILAVRFHLPMDLASPSFLGRELSASLPPSIHNPTHRDKNRSGGQKVGRYANMIVLGVKITARCSQAR